MDSRRAPTSPTAPTAPTAPAAPAARRAPPRPPLTDPDQQAYEAFYHACYPLVLECAARLLSDRHAAEDVAQGVFLRVWVNWSTVAGLEDRRRRRYALTAAHNLATDELRHRGRHPGGRPMSIEAVANGDPNRPDEEFPVMAGRLRDPRIENDPEHITLLREALHEALHEAGGDLRRAEILLLAAGYTQREVAARLRSLARHNPTVSDAAQYARATVSSIKMRRSRHRARVQRRVAQARRTTVGPDPAGAAGAGQETPHV